MDDDDDFPVVTTLITKSNKLKTYNFANSLYKQFQQPDDSNIIAATTDIVGFNEISNLNAATGNSRIKRAREIENDDLTRENENDLKVNKKKRLDENIDSKTESNKKEKVSVEAKGNSKFKKRFFFISSGLYKDFFQFISLIYHRLLLRIQAENFVRIDIRKSRFCAKGTKALSKGAKYKRDQWSKNTQKSTTRFGYNTKTNDDDDCVNKNLIEVPLGEALRYLDKL